MPLYNRIIIEGANGREITASLRLANTAKAPVAIFLHGFKGFKDWGHWRMIANTLASKGVNVLRVNFSHNGVTPKKMKEFADLDAFAENTFSKELFDVQQAIAWLKNNVANHPNVNTDHIHLIGHSRGGAIALIAANEMDSVLSATTWSGVSTLERFSEQELAYWKEKGTIFIENARTNQQMPLNYSLAQDYLDNKERYDIEGFSRGFTKPVCVVQAGDDQTVKFDEGKKLSRWFNADFHVIRGADHSFGGFHPYTESELPTESDKMVNLTAQFIVQQHESNSY